MSRPPLRWMMLVPTLVTIMAGFAAFALFIDRVERNNLIADIDDELVRAEAGFRTPAAVPENEPTPAPGPEVPTGDGPSGDDLSAGVEPPVQLVVAADGRVLAEDGAENPFTAPTLSDLATRRGPFTVDDPHFRIRVTSRPGPGDAVTVTALPLDRFDESIGDFRRTLLLGGLVIVVLEAAVVWLLTTAFIRPVTRMAATANRIADGALDTEIDRPSGSREIAGFGVDLARMVDRLRSVIEDRERSAADAVQARDDMQRFLADVSHELRTPLTALKGYSDLYAGQMLDEPEALDRAMSRIGDESERLSDLVTDMLQLARQAPTSDETELFDACDIVRVVVDDLRAAHPEIPIGLELAPDTNSVVSGRPARLHQAILNVGANACQHTDPASGVHFDARSTDSDLVIDVIDHGPGIDPAEVDKIFLPFYRHDISRGRDGRGGAGLGLAITNQILERHHGTIAVATTPGGGATFTLTLPLACPQ